MLLIYYILRDIITLFNFTMPLETLRGRNYPKVLNNFDKTTDHVYDKTQKSTIHPLSLS